MSEEDRFREAVTKSWAAVWAVGAYIHACGDFAIEIGALRLRPCQEQRNGYGDAADLIVHEIFAQTRITYPIEVKWRDLDFHNASDFPYSTIFIDRSEKAAEPIAYFMVNRTLTHAAKINRNSRASWIGPNTYFDNKRGYQVTVFECPVTLATFVELQ